MLPEKMWRPEAVVQFCAAQCACFFAGAVLVLFLHKFNIAGFKTENGAGVVLLGTLSFQGATWILMAIFFRYHHLSWQEAFGLRNKNLFHAAFLAIIVVLVFLPIALELQRASIYMLEKIGWPVEDEAAVALVAGAKLPWLKIYLGFFAVVLAPVAEEFIFRGMLFPFAKQLGFPKLAWLGVSFLFAAIHFDAAIFLPLFVLALALTWLYEKTGTLLAPIVAHGLFNAANLLILLFVSK